MRHTLQNKLFFFGSTLAAGLGSLALHRYMMEHCFDDKGLLISGNLPGRLMLLVGLVFAVALVLKTRTIGGNGEYADCFPRSVPSGLLLIAAGILMALAVPGLAQVAPLTEGVISPWGQSLERITQVCMEALPWLAAVSMAVLGVYRLLGRKAPFLPGGLICLYYMLMLVTDYRLWSADPNLQDYAYQLLAGVLLMLCSFHRTCCDAGIIQRKKILITALSAAVCAMASLSMDFQRSFYLASALWAMGSVCSVEVLPPDPEPEPEPEPETGEQPEEAEPEG